MRKPPFVNKTKSRLCATFLQKKSLSLPGGKLWEKLLTNGKLWEFSQYISSRFFQGMTNLTYTYECKVDSKGRALLPGGLKKELAPVLNEGFVIKKSVFYNCLELYPRAEWDKEMAGINQLNRFVKKNVDFIRKFMAGVKPVNLDNNDRLLIPKDLMSFAAITKEIVMTSQINKIEIWDKASYEGVIGDESVDFGTLAEEVMGGTGNTDE